MHEFKHLSSCVSGNVLFRNRCSFFIILAAIEQKEELVDANAISAAKVLRHSVDEWIEDLYYCRISSRRFHCSDSFISFQEYHLAKCNNIFSLEIDRLPWKSFIKV